MLDHRRESKQRQRHFRRRATAFGRGDYGLYIDWHVYDVEVSSVHDVYDEGLEKIYFPTRRVYPLWIVVADPENDVRAEGRHAHKVLQAAVTLRQLADAGIPIPTDVEARLDDVLEYQGEFYTQLTFDPRGHLGKGPGEETLPLTAVRRHPDDSPLDAFPEVD